MLVNDEVMRSVATYSMVVSTLKSVFFQVFHNYNESQLTVSTKSLRNETHLSRRIHECLQWGSVILIMHSLGNLPFLISRSLNTEEIVKY
jgi:hypothetical protein